MSIRSSDASSAYALAEEIADDYNALKNLPVPSTSRYASSYSAMLTCYYDCTQRIGAISESWDISLQYSDPTGHEDEETTTSITPNLSRLILRLNRNHQQRNLPIPSCYWLFVG